MAILGGSISHILTFEDSEDEWAFLDHLRGIIFSWSKAFFIATIVFWLREEYQWSLPLCLVGVGLLSVSGTDTIRKMKQAALERWAPATSPNGNSGERRNGRGN